MTIIRKHPTTRHNLPVAEIKIPQPQLATIGRRPFESIADEPLYQDTLCDTSRVPPLTLGRYFEFLGQRPDRRGSIYFPIGLLERIASLLDDRGWPVTVLGAPQTHYFSPSMPIRAAIAQADARPYTLIQLPTPRERLRVIAALRKQFPEVHLLVVTNNKAAAKWLARKLHQVTGLRVTWGIEPRTGDPWTHVDSVGTFEGRSVQDWFFVVFWDAELVLSRTSLAQILHMFGSAKFGFLIQDERQLNQIDRAMIESVFGQVVYRPGDEHHEFTEVSAVWLPAASYPASQPENQLERKRDYLWRNARRNWLIAAAALAISQIDEKALARLGLADAVRWLAGGELGLVPVSSGQPTMTVVVVVENPQHARELEPLLPGWPLVSESSFAGLVPLFGGNVIATLPLAAKATLVADAVIYAAGVGEAWFDELGLACAGITGERMLVVDVADDFDEKAVGEAHARRADYRRRGWTATTNETLSLCAEHE